MYALPRKNVTGMTTQKRPLIAGVDEAVVVPIEDVFPRAVALIDVGLNQHETFKIKFLNRLANGFSLAFRCLDVVVEPAPVEFMYKIVEFAYRVVTVIELGVLAQQNLAAKEFPALPAKLRNDIVAAAV